jgi:hypothetical protein
MHFVTDAFYRPRPINALAQASGNTFGIGAYFSV